MGTTVIIDTSKARTSTAHSTDYGISSVTGESHTAKIIDDVHSAKPTAVDYGIAKITDIVHGVRLESILPFYVRFTTTNVPGDSRLPIGLAVIGVSNYIL
jgi:hypothetical protein